MVYEHNRRPSCTVPDLVMGNEYLFRVFSENICGLSEEEGLSKNTAVISKSGADALWDGVFIFFFGIGFFYYKLYKSLTSYFTPELSPRLFCVFSGIFKAAI